MSIERREIRKQVEAVDEVEVLKCDCCGFEASGTPRAGYAEAKRPDMRNWLRLHRCSSDREAACTGIGRVSDLCPGCAAEIDAAIETLRERERDL